MKSRISNRRLPRLTILLSFALAFAACAGDGSGGDDVGRPGPYTREQFERLGWLAGDWRGTLAPDGQPFYERYRVADDSTILMHAFADSTMSVPTDSAIVYWRDGAVYHEDGATRYVAAGMDSTVVRFVPDPAGANEFTWRRTAGGWTATLSWTDDARQPRSVVYEMRPAAPRS